MAGGARPRLLAPPRPVEHDDADASRRDGRADGLRMRAHRRRVRSVRHQAHRLAARPARGPEQVAVAVAVVADDARASPATRPQARHHALLANSGLVLEPHLHRARRPARPERRTQPRRHKRPEPGPERRPRRRTAPRVLRPSRNEAKPLPPEQLANALVREHHSEGLLDLPANIANSPPNHAVALHIRTRLHPTPHNRQLPIVEKTRRLPARTIPQTLGTLRVIAEELLCAVTRGMPRVFGRRGGAFLHGFLRADWPCSARRAGGAFSPRRARRQTAKPDFSQGRFDSARSSAE